MGRASRRGFVLGLLSAGALVPAIARAEQLRVRLLVSDARVRVGEPFRVSIEVRSSGDGAVPEPTIPGALQDTEAFDVEPGTAVGAGSFRTIVGGRMTIESSRTWAFVVRPKKAGRYELASTAGQGGELARSAAVRLEVIEGDATAAEDPEAEPEAAAGGPTEARGEVLLWPRVDQTRVYVGQQLTYELEVYERMLFFSVQPQTLPTFQDFWTEELPDAQPRHEAVDGVPYRVHPWVRRALFPQRAGKLKIGAAEVLVGMRRRVSARAVEIEVLPLPSAGQPKGFSPNNVGRYTLTARVDKNAVRAGEPFTLVVEVEGTGNLRFLDPGKWPAIAGARRYDPKEETEVEPGETLGGKRRWEFLIIPEQGGTLRIPEHRLAFFDPKAGRYDESVVPEIAIEVAGGPARVEQPVAAGAGDEARIEADGEVELAPIHAPSELPRLGGEPAWLTAERWTTGMIAAPATVGTVAVAGLLWRRFGPGEATRERARVRARRQARLDTAATRVEGGEGFWAELGILLQELAVEWAGPQGVGRTRPALLGLLRERGLDEATVTRLRTALERCDAARFGAGVGDAKERARVLAEARSLSELEGGRR